MKREDFVKVAEDALDSLPEEFRSRIHNVAILVEDIPPNQSPPRPGHQARLLLGVLHGVKLVIGCWLIRAGRHRCTSDEEELLCVNGSVSHRALPEEHRSGLP